MAASKAIPKKLFKDSANVGRFSCLECNRLLDDPVQLAQCGHRLCRRCADELIIKEMTPKCPECKEDINDEDGAKVFSLINKIGEALKAVIQRLQLANHCMTAKLKTVHVTVTI